MHIHTLRKLAHKFIEFANELELETWLNNSIDDGKSVFDLPEAEPAVSSDRKRPEDFPATVEMQIWKAMAKLQKNQTIGVSTIYRALPNTSHGTISHELSKMVRHHKIVRVKVGLYRRSK